jgi:hypothetical protein
MCRPSSSNDAYVLYIHIGSRIHKKFHQTIRSYDLKLAETVRIRDSYRIPQIVRCKRK